MNYFRGGAIRALQTHLSEARKEEERRKRVSEKEKEIERNRDTEREV